MTTSSYPLADNLKDAYRVCDVVPLKDLALEQYYVDLSGTRKNNAISAISQILEDQQAEDFCTILFTGHRGGGKSTELNHIQKQWEADYKVMYVDIEVDADPNDFEYTEIYLLAIKWIEFELRKEGLKFDAQLFKNFEDWFKEVIEETEESVEKSVSMQGELTLQSEIPFVPPFLAKLLVKLLAQIKGSDKRKRVIRQTLTQDISRLKFDINLLLNDGLKKWRRKFPSCKGFLIVFDGLDKCPSAVAEKLFIDNAKFLKSLECTVVYTAPISVVYSPKNASNFFENFHVIPMINIYNYDPSSGNVELEYNQNGLDAVASLIEKRLQVDAIFESRNELLELAKYSGGHVRQVMQLVRGAIQHARTNRRSKVNLEDINYSINQLQFTFERLIPTEHYPVLAQIYLTKDAPRDEMGQLMLFNISVFEYNGLSRWNYPNPVVIRSRLFQRALEDYRSKNP
ncbi:AAA family ATPase [Pseudanabaena yagii]|uniref:AAA family ATPase n=1 Tax=Pseudanabaena yagii GIHE-NHR1 TaxID=2722753 RepID=A0ABX1LPI9_9CYAN|nr:AAA family ATPase [Pseudanabaena yagii]NMF57238.1 AAA family ATPase [Pseudanabaena yagii GIHE-NHR1]